MQPFLVIQCLTEHVDTVLSYCVCIQKEVRNFKHIFLNGSASDYMVFEWSEQIMRYRAALLFKATG